MQAPAQQGPELSTRIRGSSHPEMAGATASTAVHVLCEAAALGEQGGPCAFPPAKSRCGLLALWLQKVPAACSPQPVALGPEL